MKNSGAVGNGLEVDDAAAKKQILELHERAELRRVEAKRIRENEAKEQWLSGLRESIPAAPAAGRAA